MKLVAMSSAIVIITLQFVFVVFVVIMFKASKVFQSVPLPVTKFKPIIKQFKLLIPNN